MKAREIFSTIVAVASLLLCSNLFAQGPENTLVVVNAESLDSLAIANHYIQLRDIPATNVVYLKGITTSKKHGPESSSTIALQSKILGPILKAIEDRGIEPQIDCVAYSAGFPTRINFHPQMKKYLKQAGKKYDIHLHAPWASITSLTYFYENVLSGRPDFLELDANDYAPLRPTKLAINPFEGDDAVAFDAAMKRVKARDFAAATESLLGLARKHPMQMAVVYSLARCFALSGENKKAITTLRHALTNGFSHRSMLATDLAFVGLRTDANFKSILSEMADLPDGILSTRAFSGQHFWGKNGWPNGTRDQGERYLLSCVLAVTGKNQSTLEDSIARLKTSVKADGTNPVGHVYFADHKDPRSRTRSRQFRPAVEELRAIGRDASIGSGKLPKKNDRVIGATLGSPVLDWKKSGSAFLPGAICDNFTSYGGWWQKKGQTQLSEFLDAGAAGACGTVYEPYTIWPKITTARWHAHYARGATLAESHFQSVSGPFQLLLVGDPLCCPFGKFPEFEIEGLKEGAAVKTDFVFQIVSKAKSPKIRRYEMYYDGVLMGNVANPRKVSVATDAMNDGYHELRIVGVSDSPTANRRSKKVGFVFNRQGHELSLSIENPKCRSSGKIVGQAASSLGKPIEIRHNSRALATVGGDGKFSLACSKVGLGKSKLQAIAMLDDGTVVQSSPVEVEVRN